MSNKTNSEKELLARIADLEKQIKVLKDRKKFGLVWEDKPEDVVLSCETHVPTLKEVKTRKLVTDNSLPTNILIEGDNYHSLSVLNYTHKGKIDVIYIDPPYNTGSTDWVYNNDYVDKEDSFRHSKWISFMFRRLELAKSLLSDEGLICVAIDDYEIHTLGLLLAEVFGEENKIGLLAIRHHPRGRTQSNFFSTTHEYALFFAKDARKVKTDFCFPSNQKEEIESLIRSREDATPENRPNLYYPLYVSDKGEVSINKTNIYKNEVLPINKNGNRVWKLVKDSLQEEIDNGLIFAENKKGEWSIYRKIVRSNTNKAQTIWTDTSYDANSHGTNLLKNIFENNIFNFPKSLYTVRDIVLLMSKNINNSIILDFFAGSGTTGHAVLELNKEDGGDRKFILCTNNENKIAEEVTYERLKRVIKGYKNKKGEKVEGLGSNLSYYKTDLVDIEKLQRVSDESKIKITYQAGEMIAIRENTLDETDKNDWWQIFENEERKTAIYFKEDKSKLSELVTLLEKENKPTTLYIFGWGKNEYKNEYSTKNIKVEDIPEPIIEVYKEINRI